jgi:hypothetical protein
MLNLFCLKLLYALKKRRNKMKKVLSLLTVVIFVLSVSIGAMATEPPPPSNPNWNPGVPEYTTVCGVTVSISHQADQGQFIHAGYDGEWVLLRNETGTFNFPAYVFGRNLHIFVHGNTLVGVVCSCECCKDTGPGEPVVTYRPYGDPIIKITDETVRTVLSATLGTVDLYQVNRNHPGPVPLYLFGDRNGNVNFMRTSGSMEYRDDRTIVTVTIQRMERVYTYPDGTEVTVRVRPVVTKVTEESYY